MNAVLGFAGLPVTLSALTAGKRLALANKESLIAAAPLVAKVRSTPGATLLPVDSEHCAIHQCLASSPAEPGYPDVRRLLLTASGGPFRGWSLEQLRGATKADALNHPTWSMGAKITIDSSTLMNKGLEVLEASALFGIDVERVEVVVHPQSIVHSMVEYVDGSVLAQLSRPDMRLPIAYCLGLPVRLDHGWGAIDFTQDLELTFEAPDPKAFPGDRARLRGLATRRRGAGVVECRQRSRGRGVPSRRDPLVRHHRRGRARDGRLRGRSAGFLAALVANDATARATGARYSQAIAMDSNTETRRSLIALLVGIAVVVALLTWLVGWALPLVIFAIIFIVMAHEFGHFITAKRAGLKVTDFFVGFGPVLWSTTIGETRYGVRAILAGGYVKVPGHDLDRGDPRGRERAPTARRRTRRRCSSPRPDR